MSINKILKPLILVSIIFWISAFTASKISYSPAYIKGFTAYDLKSDTLFRLRGHIEEKAVVLIFHGNNCPFSLNYEDRIRELMSTYADQKITFAYVNSNNAAKSPKDKRDVLKSRMNEFSCSYLLDIGGDLSSDLRVRKNPEVVVLMPGKNSFKLIYKGAIDDNPQMPSYVNKHYLKAAIDHVLSGDINPIPEHKAIGCLIRD